MRRFISILLTLILPGTILPVVGQDIDRPAFRRFNVEDGLSQGSINSIFQDHKGFVWIGTFDGLNRFDGAEFRVFRSNPADSASLSSNWIIQVFEDDAGTLWVRTEKGLDRYNRAAESFSRALVGGAVVVPWGSKEKPGLIVKEKILILFDPATGQKRPADFRYQDNSPLMQTPGSILRDDAGNLWLVGDSTIMRIAKDGRVVSDRVDIGKHQVAAFLPSRHRRGDVWLGIRSHLLKITNGRLLTIGSFPVVSSLAEDTHGFLWIGTGEGLLRIAVDDTNASRVARFRHDPAVATSLCHDIVTCLFEDVSGGLWVGTHNGLNRHDRFSPSFTVYRNSPGDPGSIAGNFILPIVEDRKGNIWFGTFGTGLSVLLRDGPKAGSFIHFRHDPRNPNSLRGDNVRSLLCTRDGKVWIGSSGGMNVYDPAIGAMTASPESIAPSWIETICETANGSVWFVAQNQLVRLDESRGTNPTVRRYDIPSSGSVVSMLEGNDGMLWLASNPSGLIMFNPRTEAFTSYLHDNSDPFSISNNNVWTVHQDPADTTGTLWVGTSDGLNKFDTRTGRSTRYLEQAGFPNDWVYGILQDDQRRLWLSTNHGLVLFDDSRPEGRKFRNYTHEDGIAGDEFNRRSFCRLRNGELLFGGTNGVTRFDPGLMRDNPVVPPLVLTGFFKAGLKATFDTDVADVKSIELNHDESVFSFEYAALNYTNPSKNRYAYMMEGIDHEWVDAGERRFVNYAYVPAGEYTFRVRASHIPGVWNAHEIAVRVHISPPFWATWWFILLVALAAGGAITAGVRARIRRLLEMERLRTRIARDLHDEIGSNLSSIAVASDLLKRRREFGDDERRKLTEISSVALSTVKDMKDIVWLIKPGNNSLDDLFLRMKDTAAALLDGCHYVLDFPESPVGKRVNLEWRQHVYLIYKEALTNVARHARADEVHVTARVGSERLTLIIEDNGRGFMDGSTTGGNGLKNMRERAEVLKGDLTIGPGNRGGTKITLAARIT